jgi:hypothetical protein
MSTNFPGSLDTSTTIPAEGASTPLSTNHVTAHQNIQDAIEAIEAKVGADSSAVTTSHDYKLSEVTSTDKAVGKTATQTISNKTLGTGTKIAIGSDADKDMYYRASDGTLTRIPVGTDNQILKLNGTTPNWEAETVNVDATTSVKGIVELATEAELTAGTATGSTGAALVVTPDIIYKRIKFGGTGADGALSVSSGNTNIDLGGAQFVVKNYTSISITGTGSVTFINPHANGSTIYLKSQGNVTLTSSAAPMLDASGCGTAGGARGVNGATATAGTDMSASVAFYSTVTNSGGRPATGASSGAPSTAITNPSFYGASLRAITLNNERLPVLLLPGCGGGGGSSNNNPSAPGVAGNGGNGGGALYIECAGAWNFTTTNGISVAGKNGENASGTTNSAGGGGGGAPGMFLALYNTLTANTGTVNVSIGSGGTGLTVIGTPYAGGGGSSAGNAGGSSPGAGAGGVGGAAITNAALVIKNDSIA